MLTVHEPNSAELEQQHRLLQEVRGRLVGLTPVVGAGVRTVNSTRYPTELVPDNGLATATKRM